MPSLPLHLRNQYSLSNRRTSGEKLYCRYWVCCTSRKKHSGDRKLFWSNESNPRWILEIWILGPEDNKEIREAEEASKPSVRESHNFPLSSAFTPACFHFLSYYLSIALSLFTFCVFRLPPPTCCWEEAHYFIHLPAHTHTHTLSLSVLGLYHPQAD